jgi:hypothetical protein
VYNLVPFITIFNLGIKKIQPALNQGSRVDGINTDIPHFAKNLEDSARRLRRFIVVQKIPGPTSLKLKPNAMNSSDQSLNHLFMNITVYSLFFSSINSSVLQVETQTQNKRGQTSMPQVGFELTTPMCKQAKTVM